MAGVIPTPLDAVARSAGVTEIVDIAHLPTGLVAKRPSLLRRVVGAIFYRERVVFVDRSQGVPRGRFIEAHEVSHKIIPWHEAIFRLDDKERIFGPTKRTLDIEADIGRAPKAPTRRPAGSRIIQITCEIGAYGCRGVAGPADLPPKSSSTTATYIPIGPDAEGDGDDAASTLGHVQPVL